MFKKLTIIGLASFSGLFLMAGPANALPEFVHCDVPVSGDLETDPGMSYCDIRARTFGYREQDAKFNEQLHARQKNYYKAQKGAVKRNEESLKSYHEKIAKKYAPAATTESTLPEIYGPTSPDQ